ncbi:NAD(P)-dependent oxidoreductase [Nocardia huaxiensis]|uniref:SDR family oxidoreductase n=1 Tax=Nocardia huaxiensis TaxID=2755382 RepID=A0A7D6ZHK3_9NOCA|nr:NAD(P)-binding oxidoreductase [Nocardia huaxiensis]QLY29900.1 SDR family oxidoreductase [Nocardia huaxiensis]UFS96511.1 SDR family oxidoreductase [Nocardia huaxiensis]
MRLTIFGASGSTGTHLVEQALVRGHLVTAVVRGEHSFGEHDRLTVVTADVMDPADIADALDGADAVLSAVGARQKGPTSVCADAAESIAAAMDKTGARRLLLVSNSARIAGPGDEPFTRYVVKPLILRPLLRHSLDDMSRAESIVEATDLDWTIVRAPQLTDNPAKGRSRMAVERNVTFGIRITRADLATRMLDLVSDRDAVHRHVNVAN